jgi:predicted metal-dependent phosphoesterase TrpH
LEPVTISSAEHQPFLKGALHTHSTCSDGELPPLEVLRVYRDLGFDFLALTDHDFLMRPNAYQDVPDEFEGMIVFKGVEKTLFARGYLHVNVIPGVSETLHIFNHPAEYDFSYAQIIERLAQIQQGMPIHAIEVSQKGFYTAEYDTDDIPLPKVVSDDSHTLAGCGRAWVEVPCEKNRDAIIRAIKQGAARNVYKGHAQQAQWIQYGGK